MARDFKLDPATKDYVTVDGAPFTQDDLGNNIYLSLAIEYSKWWAAPTFGKKRLDREKAIEDRADREREYCEEALAWIIESGRAEKIEVETALLKDGDTPRLDVTVTAWRSNLSEPQVYNFKEVR